MTSNLHLNSLLFLAALVLVWLSMLLLGAGAVDHQILLTLYAGHRPLLADAARLATMLGDGRVVTIFAGVGALVLISRKQPWPAIVLFVGTALGKAFTELQKYEFNRLRPAENPHLVAVHNLSFPSGHSANSMMTYVALALLFSEKPEQRPIWILGAVVLAIIVGFSRVMLGVHWPSDVVGGWSYGLFWAFLIYGISQAGWRREESPMTARRPFTMLAAAIFLLMALVHLYRLVVGFDISIAGTHVSLAISWIALAVTALLAVMLYNEARR